MRMLAGNAKPTIGRGIERAGALEKERPKADKTAAARIKSLADQFVPAGRAEPHQKILFHVPAHRRQKGVVDAILLGKSQIDHVGVRHAPSAKQVLDPIGSARSDRVHQARAKRQMQDVCAAAFQQSIDGILSRLATDPEIVIVGLVPAALGRGLVQREFVADRRLVGH